MIVEHGKTKFKHWNCGGCGKLLGIIYPSGTLAVKYKDLVAWATGEYKTICRVCQTENIYKTANKLNEYI